MTYSPASPSHVLDVLAVDLRRYPTCSCGWEGPDFGQWGPAVIAWSKHLDTERAKSAQDGDG